MTAPNISPALRADLDRELSNAVDLLLAKAAELDGMDIIEANVELTAFLYDRLDKRALAAAAAATALRLHRSRPGGEGGS